MWIASTHSRSGLIKLEKQGWVLWILHSLQSPRPHGDGTCEAAQGEIQCEQINDQL